MNFSVISTAVLLMMALNAAIFALPDTKIIERSRSNCVRVVAPGINSSGTGFLIDATHVVTCFHVVAAVQIVDAAKGEVRWGISGNITVKMSDGEVIEATCVSVPTQQDQSPLFNDFAILKLSRRSQIADPGLPLYKSNDLPGVGSDILFSGFPLGAPSMITHKGFISGASDDRSVICVEAPVNKGNSGGALLDAKGEVLGIVSNREGGISQGLADVTRQITDLEQGTSGVRLEISMGGVNTLGATKELINTLDMYISTGIGYARSIKALREYLLKNPEVLQQ